MQDAGLDALIATTPANIRYFTGYHSWVHQLMPNQTSVVFTVEGKCILLIPASDADFITMCNFIVDSVKTYGKFFFETLNTPTGNTKEVQKLAAFLEENDVRESWHDCMCEVLEANGLSKAIVGLDQEQTVFSFQMMLQERHPFIKIKDSSTLMLRIRARKTAYEVDLLRKSSACTEAAISSSLVVAATGASDQEIRQAFIRGITDSGAEHLFSAVGVGTRTSFPNVQPNGTCMKEGQLLRYDVGCSYHGYASDISRIAAFGQTPEKVHQYYQAMLCGEEAAIGHMRPGVLACEVYEAAMEGVRQNGVPHYRRHHCGHGIGLDIYEPPLIQPTDRTPLDAGMTFCVETPYYELGFGGIQVEDMVLVTDEGTELLTGLSRELFEILGSL